MNRLPSCPIGVTVSVAVLAANAAAFTTKSNRVISFKLAPFLLHTGLTLISFCPSPA